MSNATELLRRALDALDDRAYTPEWYQVKQDIRAYLAAEKEAEPEPVAWIQPNHLDKAQFMPFLCRVEPKQRDDFIPIYTRPEPARKPMTEEEVSKLFQTMPTEYEAGFREGIRFAEKRHGIGGSDE